MRFRYREPPEPSFAKFIKRAGAVVDMREIAFDVDVPAVVGLAYRAIEKAQIENYEIAGLIMSAEYYIALGGSDGLTFDGYPCYIDTGRTWGVDVILKPQSALREWMKAK